MQQKLYGIVYAGAALAALLLLSAPCAAQTAAAPAVAPQVTAAPAPSLQALVVVRDKKGLLVKDLNLSSFAASEDGKPLGVMAVEAPGEPPLTLGLLFDTGRSQRRQLDAEREAARTFLSSLRYDKDKCFILHFDREVELLQDFTSSRQKLEKSLDLLKTSEMPPPNSGDNSRDDNQRGGDQQSGGPSLGSVLDDAVFLSADELLKGATGRPVLILVSGGFDSNNKVTWERAIEAAQRANTVIYTIYDPGKLDTPAMGGDRGSRGSGRGGMGGGGGWPGSGGGWPGGNSGGGRGGSGGGNDKKDIEHQREEGRRTLERMARESGGHFFELNKKLTLGDAFTQITEELRAQYRLTIAPPTGREGFHSLRITATRNDTTAQARTGFYTGK